MGISTARLPIDPGRLTASTVLTVNQVVEILLSYNETQDWHETLDRCLPQRKVKKDHIEKQEEEDVERPAEIVHNVQQTSQKMARGITV